MEKLVGVEGLIVSQGKEWTEILTGFETRNKYVVMDTAGAALYTAVEEGGSLLARWFLKAWRPFRIEVRSLDRQLVLSLKRPFRFYFHEIAVHDASGQLLGTIKRQFTVLRRKYTVMDPAGREVFQLFGPILHPWTFEIRQDDEVAGKITKKWSGFLKETFTTADNFGVTLPVDWDVKTKALFLGAVFLIDFVHFEKRNN